eukprot:CAMPEP_0198235864 /NCGR_PEP_ID=MMETSP1446-20131203/1749_1 /TAXON_ID=1461542 ORGANISM="Unidentified sp, Strain CCMP2111" /NCGR_SAMPLE_ID=MMETSP1446 /ASSEMBLY_ACC=CAM_ASM_001112 /LENGTH=132 /DNA_ID=CAMNT_0043917269 /DNA_START=233 /DNA_END=628 /DNA_ORIENTATION=-
MEGAEGFRFVRDRFEELEDDAAATTTSTRRASGVTLLALLQDLSELLALDDKDSPQAELDAVGSRVASLLPPLLEEYCQKENPDKSEILSICKLVRLALRQFPSIFCGDGNCSVDYQTTSFWILSHFLQICV